MAELETSRLQTQKPQAEWTKGWREPRSLTLMDVPSKRRKLQEWGFSDPPPHEWFLIGKFDRSSMEFVQISKEKPHLRWSRSEEALKWKLSHAYFSPLLILQFCAEPGLPHYPSKRKENFLFPWQHLNHWEIAMLNQWEAVTTLNSHSPLMDFYS